MTATREGGLKIAKKLTKKDPDYYSIIGKRGAKAYMEIPANRRKPRGFAVMDKTKLKEVSAKGGRNRHKGLEK